MIPLRIRAYLQSGVVSDPFLPIDGVLYYQVHREALGSQTLTVPGAPHGSASDHHPLPLQKVNTYKRHDSRLWFYAASFAVWPEHTVEGVDYWNKRTDVSLVHLVDWQERKPRIEISAGRYKSYHMPVFYRSALYVDWYVVGDQVEIERLLKTVTNLGKKYSQGWGSVLRFEIEPWPEDWSIRNGSGQLMRAIPSDDSRAPLYGLKPSYWNPRHQFPCHLPDLPKHRVSL